MLKSFFSFVQRKALSFRSAQKMMLRALKTKEQYAALYLRYAKALEPYSSKQAAIFTAMGIQELENYKKLLCLSCSSRTSSHSVSAVGSLRKRPSFVTSKRHHANSRTTTTNQTTKKPSKTQKQTLLTWIQPGLAGLMDGSVSTLAPIFAAAFATGDTHQTFLIGLSASIGAGLSMGFTEAAHDDGKLSGRGSPFKRGLASGIMTTLGGLGHALPYLINSFYVATVLAFVIVFFELWAIVWIQNKFMSTPFWRASLQVIIGGALVFATGIFIGNI
ncbi:membrane protein [Bartonella quintana]|uniref:BfsE n=3 Tax=Bartonella quintana TaxID=803 RepID=W3U0D6_BARQI|nr:membrane protein [Bartonella quintana]AEG20913.1 BfsE [Bartonella quintana]AEG20914.1 BfsE [Bartonella quintana]AEG20915.1 BfsE [Bartonella quintana]AEG20917.1 BfsE [Bartonella quintana]AEG20918.1 BfsE [Bartonella quintana]